MRFTLLTTLPSWAELILFRFGISPVLLAAPRMRMCVCACVCFCRGWCDFNQTCPSNGNLTLERGTQLLRILFLFLVNLFFYDWCEYLALHCLLFPLLFVCIWLLSGGKSVNPSNCCYRIATRISQHKRMYRHMHTHTHKHTWSYIQVCWRAYLHTYTHTYVWWQCARCLTSWLKYWRISDSQSISSSSVWQAVCCYCCWYLSIRLSVCFLPASEPVIVSFYPRTAWTVLPRLYQPGRLAVVGFVIFAMFCQLALLI